MQAKARNQFGAKSIHGTANRTGGLIGEKEYEGPGVNDSYDNDASFDQFLNSNSAAYFQNPEDKEAYGENRWKSGGGVNTGGARGIQALGKSRDEDGTVDRVRDPPQELLPLLYACMQCSSYNIDLYDTLQAAGFALWHHPDLQIFVRSRRCAEPIPVDRKNPPTSLRTMVAERNHQRARSIRTDSGSSSLCMSALHGKTLSRM